MGWMEMIFVLAILLLIFGPSKLPKIAQDLGKAIYDFRKASSGIVEAIESPSLTKGTGSQGDAITDIAKKLNINTGGKTMREITKEIITKIEGDEKTTLIEVKEG